MHANHHVSIWWSFKRKWHGPFKNSAESNPFRSFPAPPLKPRPCVSPVQGLHRIGWLKGWKEREGAPWALIRHHQTEQSSALMRTAERYSGLMRIAPEPRAPIPATKKQQSSLWRTRNPTPIKRRKLALCCAILKKIRQVIINQKPTVIYFCFHIYIITGCQQERLFKYPVKIKFVSHQRGEWQTEPPHNFAQQWDGSTELLYMLQHCAASQQGIITQWQRRMTPRTHF